MEKVADFIYDDLYDVMDEFMDVIGDGESVETKFKENTLLYIKPYHIDIPQIHACVREGIWYSGDSEAELEMQDSVYILYDLGEEDINEYKWFATQDMYYVLHDACKDAHYPLKKINELKCSLVLE